MHQAYYILENKTIAHTLKTTKGNCFWIRKLRTLSWSTRSKNI